MKSVKTVTVPVKAGISINYGKMEYYYKPLDDRGVKLLETTLIQAGKNSSRTTYTEALAKSAHRIGQMSGVEIVFSVQEAAPIPKPERILKAGDVLDFNQEQAVPSLDLGFLG